MPCYDAEDTDEKRHAQRMLPKVEAALCGVLTALERTGGLDDVIRAVDWEKAGVDALWLGAWWAEHQARDGGRGYLSKVPVDLSGARGWEGRND